MRSWVLDAGKGIAILFVIVYHVAFDLQFFAHLGIDTHSLLWWLIGRTAACMFIVIAGICFALQAQQIGIYSFPLILARSIKLMRRALLITLATWLFIGEGTIVFGILHFLAVAPLIAFFIAQSRPVLVSSVALVCFATRVFDSISVDNSYFVWLGLEPTTFVSLDHYPLVPWMAVYLLGTLIGTLVPVSFWYGSSYPKVADPFVKIGKHTLLIYTVHQPIIIGLLYLTTYFR